MNRYLPIRSVYAREVLDLSLIHISEPTRPIGLVGSEMCIRDRCTQEKFWIPEEILL